MVPKNSNDAPRLSKTCLENKQGTGFRGSGAEKQAGSLVPPFGGRCTFHYLPHRSLFGQMTQEKKP